MTSEGIKQAFGEHLDHSEALREYLKSLREQSDFVIPSEPKILRLVQEKL